MYTSILLVDNVYKVNLVNIANKMFFAKEKGVGFNPLP